jgi:hypothetical protein
MSACIRDGDRPAHSRFACKADVKHEGRACAAHEQTIAKWQADVRAGSLPDARSATSTSSSGRASCASRRLPRQDQQAAKPIGEPGACAGSRTRQLGRQRSPSSPRQLGSNAYVPRLVGEQVERLTHTAVTIYAAG